MSTQTATIIDGKALARATRTRIKQRVEALRAEGKPVRLDAVLASANAGANIYAENQAKTCKQVGIDYSLHKLPAEASQDQITETIRGLNADPNIHAIMCHLPLPEEVDTEAIQSLIDVDKDVEGVNPANIGRVVYGQRSLIPCTSRAVIEMIESTGIRLPGKRCVVVGASNIVGKPVVVLLMSAEATVLSTNIHTENIQDLARSADVLVAAAGVPELVTKDWVKPGAVVIDVGINRVTDSEGNRKTVGDVAFDEVAEIAGAISPVPGGVGPMTVAMLLSNTVEAAAGVGE